MKKIILLFLTLGSLVMANAENNIEKNREIMLGGWQIAEMEPVSLPEKVATGFLEAFKNILGAEYVPVLYCGSQIVAGKNHVIICKQKAMTNPPVEHLVKVILYENIKGEFQIKSIEGIL